MQMRLLGYLTHHFGLAIVIGVAHQRDGAFHAVRYVHVAVGHYSQHAGHVEAFGKLGDSEASGHFKGRHAGVGGGQLIGQVNVARHVERGSGWRHVLSRCREGSE
jgi:hypothetical protein